MQRFRNSGLDVGRPLRVLLRKGDGVIAHQRLAHSGGYNLSDKVRMNIYFRVSRIDFADIADAYVKAPTPWIGFGGLSSILPSGSTDVPTQCDEDNFDRITPAQVVLAARPIGRTLSSAARERLTITKSMKLSFVQDGFLVLKNVINSGLVQKARRKIDMALHNGKFSTSQRNYGDGSQQSVITFNKHVLTSCMLTDVLFRTGLVDVAEELLGSRAVVLLDSTSDIRYIPVNDSKGDNFIRPGGWDVSLGIGRHRLKGLDHMLRISVPLTDGLDVDENRGQIVVWPGMSIYFQSCCLQNSVYLNSSLTAT